MGACYSVVVKVKFNNEEDKEKARLALKEEIDKHDPRNWCREENNNLETFEDCLKVFLASHQRNYYTYEEKGFMFYTSGFNASYGWEAVLYDMERILKPYLAKGSKVIIDAD